MIFMTDLKSISKNKVNKKKATIINWQQVFNTNHKFWWSLDEARKVANESGYTYLCWNGNVYYSASGKRTMYVVEDVK